MIELVIDGRCSSCPDFEVEDFKTELGDHIILCRNRKLCWEKQKEIEKRGGRK